MITYLAPEQPTSWWWLVIFGLPLWFWMFIIALLALFVYDQRKKEKS